MRDVIAIHHRPGSFSDRWIEYCQLQRIPYKVVNCYEGDVIAQVSQCRALMWHFAQNSITDMLMARSVLEALQVKGVAVFPSRSAYWHFDDKVAQKYLLDAVGVPAVPTFVFFNKRDAYRWIEGVSFPKVFKLKGGAGSANVRLVETRSEALRLVRRAFSRGFPAVPRMHSLSERWWQFRRDRTARALINLARGAARVVIRNPELARFPRESHYVYFQEFIPDNDSDIRVFVVGGRAFALRRMTRDGDFRASGSGRAVYDPASIPLQCVANAFKLATDVGAQCLAIDFVLQQNEALVVEVSYGSPTHLYLQCPGYWLKDLSFVRGRFRPEDFMVDEVLASLGCSA